VTQGKIQRINIALELMLEQTLQEFENKLGFRPGEKSGFLSISTFPYATLTQRVQIFCGGIPLIMRIETAIKINKYNFMVEIIESEYEDFRCYTTSSTCQPDPIIVEQSRDACMAKYLKYLNNRKKRGEGRCITK
jgi:hypothetical protein